MDEVGIYFLLIKFVMSQLWMHFQTPQEEPEPERGHISDT